VVELGKGIWLRPAQSTEAQSIARLVRQLGKTLRGGSVRWLWLEIWFGLGLCAVSWSLWMNLWLNLWTNGWMTIALFIPLGGLMVLAGLLVWYIPKVNWADYWVVEVGGEIVACAKLYEGEATCELYDVFVVPAWRGQGFGTALLKQLLAQARYPVYLASLPNTISFYEALGFHRMSNGPHNSPLDFNLKRRLSLMNPKYQRLGLTPMRYRSHPSNYAHGDENSHCES